MRRAYKKGAVGSPPSAPAAPSLGYAADPGGGSATVRGSFWHYIFTEEIVSTIEAAGIAPDDTPQFAVAIRALAKAEVLPTGASPYTPAPWPPG